MARGDSGRLVLEIDPEFKREFYAALALEGLTAKDWFLGKARDFVEGIQQPWLSAELANSKATLAKDQQVNITPNNLR
jgi:hypothetical protein